MNSKNTAKKVLAALKKKYPDAGCSLRHHSPLQLLVATILSAQCTDVQVNKITPALFVRYKTVQDFADASLDELESMVKTTGFYRNKAKNIRHCCEQIIADFGGKIPETLAELTTLPGVGRKTANVVLGNAFGKNEGFVVDTHVFRLSHRIGLAEGNTPEKTEQELMKVFPQDDWAYLSHTFILLGREICKARKPMCEVCPLEKFCGKFCGG
ncbi:MAG: endonuclease III [Planctomycetaceae bacterium]|nr:endonuclease III [Planctomycetaceae bacterium]